MYTYKSRVIVFICAYVGFGTALFTIIFGIVFFISLFKNIASSYNLRMTFINLYLWSSIVTYLFIIVASMLLKFAPQKKLNESNKIARDHSYCFNHPGIIKAISIVTRFNDYTVNLYDYTIRYMLYFSVFFFLGQLVIYKFWHKRRK